MSQAIQFECPQCGASTTVSQVQGDRCDGCGFEFKWFGPGEEHVARDYYAVLTRQKHLLLVEGAGFIVAHE
jgi:hypothetical protein